MSSVMPINQSVSQPIKQSTNQSTKGWKSLQCHWQLVPAEPPESTFYLSQSHCSWQGQSRSQPSTMGGEAETGLQMIGNMLKRIFVGWVGSGGTMAHYCITACSEV